MMTKEQHEFLELHTAEFEEFYGGPYEGGIDAYIHDYDEPSRDLFSGLLSDLGLEEEWSKYLGAHFLKESASQARGLIEQLDRPEIRTMFGTMGIDVDGIVSAGKRNLAEIERARTAK